MSSKLPFSTGQTAVLAILGAVLWFIAAVLIKWLGPMGIFEGMARVWLYLLVIPGTLPFLLVCYRIAQVARAHFALAAAVMTGTATLLDGIALAWFPGLYGSDVTATANAGALILWGAGVAIWLGIVMNRSD